MFGILWLNKRNIDYIKKRNPKKQIRLANSKYHTKKFLSERGIPVPQTLWIIKNRKKLFQYNFSQLKTKNFVIKPNQWSKGRGVFIIKKIEDQQSNANKKKGRIHKRLDKRQEFLYSYKQELFEEQKFSINKKTITDKELKQQLVSIIDGQYSIGSKNDVILIEELIKPSKDFWPFCEYGLADIRVICFNLVPVAAMLRMPTKKSGGKANLAQWGIWFWIEISSGKIIAMKGKTTIYHESFPEEYGSFFHKKIANREDILLYSSSIQYFTNIWFIWLDRVLTPQWPKILEINARAGLEIQNITLSPLENILSKIEDLNISTPEKGVEIAKSLFSIEKTTEIPTAKTVYLSQPWKVKYIKQDDSGDFDVIASVNTKKKRNYISKSLANKLKQSQKVSLELGNGIIIKEPNLHKSLTIKGNHVELGTETLKSFYIKPIHKSKIDISFIKQDSIISDEIDQIQILDQKIHDITKTISLSSVLNPTNYLEEFDKFITRRGKYNPQFMYSFPHNKKINEWEYSIKKLRETQKWWQLLRSPFAWLFYEKILENINKIELIKAYKSQDYELIEHCNKTLYEPIQDTIVKQSIQKLNQIEKISNPKELIYTAQWLKEELWKYVKDEKIKEVEIIITPSIQARVSVVTSPKTIIKINSHMKFSEKDRVSLIEHEIETHIRRYQQGKKSWRHILQKGTANYLTTEEWLAIYNATKKLQTYDPNYENSTILANYYLTYQATQHNFQQLTELITANNVFKKSWDYTLYDLFRKTTRFKKWIVNTKIRHAWASNYKNKIYLDWLHQIEQVKNTKSLYIGKIKIDDMKYFK